jgi:hypothetical protein
VDAKINGIPVRLIFDTGTDISVLFRPTAERLGLQVTKSRTDEKLEPDRIPCGSTEPFNLTLWDKTKRARFGVIDLPAAPSTAVEGILGWKFFNKNIIQFDTLNLEFEFLDQVPKKTAKWLNCHLQIGADTLVMGVPNQASETELIAVDTGSEDGISLNLQNWQKWTAAHPNRTKTVRAYYTPSVGMVVTEVAWASEISFGQLILTDVPVQKADSADMTLGSTGCQATFGLAALKRLNFIVDGKSGIAYLQPKKTPPVSFRHNRIGAVFVPTDLQKRDHFVAHVLDGSPAYEAGIRNDDVLLTIESYEVKNPAFMYSMRSFESTAGKKVKLTLRRAQTEYQTTVVLRDLIGPNAGDHAAKRPVKVTN